MTDIHRNEWIAPCARLANFNLGFGRHELADIVAAAIRELSHGTTIYDKRSHIPAPLLAKQVGQITAAGLGQFFWASGGSDQLEPAIEIAR